MKRFIFASFLIASCGTDQVVDRAPPTGNPPVVVDPNQKPSFARIQQLHDQYCVQCHANSGFLRSEDALKSSTAKQRVLNKNMPQRPVVMPDAARAEYLSFFSS